MAYSSKKLGGSGSGFVGTSIYDGVFSGSAPFPPSSFSSAAASRPEDYAEIFGGPRDTRRSSIPVLDVPALRDRNVTVDVRSLKLEYSNIFGGGSDDAAPSYVDVFVEPRKMRNLSRHEQNEAHTRSSSGVSFGGLENHPMCSKASHLSPDKLKKRVNMSFHKNVGRVKDGLDGMTHVAKFRDVPGYACLVDENDPSKLPQAADKPVNNGAGDQSEKARDMKMPEAVLSSSSLDKQYSKDIHQNRSRSNSSLFEGYEFGLRAEPSEVQASTDFVHNISSMKGNFSPGKVSEGGVSIGSPTYFDGEVDASSVAAASADAVRKAIEQAQARIKIAKEIMERRKEASQGDGDSKSFREPRRVCRKASVYKEMDPPEQKIPAKNGSESKYINDHGIHSYNVSRHRNEWLSRDTVECNLPEKAAERDARMLTMNMESEEIKIKPLENKQGSEKTIPLTDHCNMPMKRMMIENVPEVMLTNEVEAAPLLDVCDKTECRPSTSEGAQKTDNHSDKSESGGPLQFVEIDEKDLEYKGEKHEKIEEHAGYSNDKEYHANTEGFNESSSDINLDDHRVYEKIVRTEYTCMEENEEKVSEGHEVGSVRPKDIPSGEEETGSTACMIFDKMEEHEGEGECYARECDQEQNNKQSENCEAEAKFGLKNISDGVVESTSLKTIEGKEESSEAPGESRETNGEEKTEATDYRQESKKEHSGFNLGADARQWLDNMKEMLNVRINSFLDAKENNRPQEDADVEDNCQLEAEVSDEKIVEETGEAEAKEEMHGAPETMIDEKTIIEVNTGREVAGENTADEGKDDGREDIDGITEALDEDKESVVMDSTSYEDERDEVIAHVTNPSVEERELPDVINLSVDETESQDIDGINSNKSESTNLSDDRGECLHNNVEEEEVCVSETSDWTRSSAKTEAEKQVQDTVEEEGLSFLKGDLNLGFTGIKYGFWHSSQHAERPEEICEMVKHVEECGPQVDEFPGNENASEISTKEEEGEDKDNETELKAEVADDYRWSDNEKTADVSSNDEEESEEMTDEMDVKSKTSDDQRWGDNEAIAEENQMGFVLEREEKNMDDIQETTTSQVTEEENEPTAQVLKENESEDYSQGIEAERPAPKKRDARKRWEKDNERDREKERLVVERAIREARERAFADARERAERAAVEKANAEARQRVMSQAREKMGKSSLETSSKPAEKTSAEARLRAERAAVERATAEARERALERAMLEKLSGAGKDNKVRPKPSYDSQHKSSAPSSNNRNSNSSNNGAPRPTEKSNGANAESAQWSKARLERHQRTAERAAKALAEKNMRDHIAQREQAERNRLAESLDADIKRWSNGKQGNLRALLSTLQYILGPDSGWQPVTLTEIVTSAAMKKAYRKATLCVHPDKLQQRGASLQQKYICEKVFDLLKEAWNRSSAEEK